jgi:hypothetical protein
MPADDDLLSDYLPSASHRIEASADSDPYEVDDPTGPSPSRDGRDSKLITCDVCGHHIAVDAKTCPRCGTKNDWVHPEIKRFLNAASQFNEMPAFQYTVKGGTRLEGIAEVQRGAHAMGRNGMVATVIGLLLVFVIPPLGLVLAMVGFGMIIISSLSATRREDYFVEFSVDFRTPKPTWASNDDKFWKPIKEFFYA